VFASPWSEIRRPEFRSQSSAFSPYSDIGRRGESAQDLVPIFGLFSPGQTSDTGEITQSSYNLRVPAVISSINKLFGRALQWACSGNLNVFCNTLQCRIAIEYIVLSFIICLPSQNLSYPKRNHICIVNMGNNLLKCYPISLIVTNITISQLFNVLLFLQNPDMIKK